MYQETIKLLRNAGLSDKIVSEIAATYKPAYRLIPAKKEDYSVVGNSRIGGLPDLPNEIKHPLSSSGEAKQLVVQINLNELVEDVFPNLPKSGILYFFNDFDDYDGELIYYGGELEKLELSDYHLEDIDNCGPIYNGYKLAFELIPTIDQHLLYVENITNDFDDIYEKLKASLLSQEPRLGGNGTSSETDHIRAAFSLHGNITDEDQEMLRFNLHLEGNNSYPTFQHWIDELKNEKLTKADREHISKRIDRNKQLVAYAPKFIQNRSFYQDQIRKWHNLLNITSIDECGMCWSDAGTLTLCANEDEVLNHNFSNIYCGLDCG